MNVTSARLERHCGLLLLTLCIAAPAAWSQPVRKKPTPLSLGTFPGGTETYPVAINESGQVVGRSRTAGHVFHAFQWTDGTLVDLGTFADGQQSYASGINDHDEVVGYVTDFSGPTPVFKAFLWRSGALMDLGDRAVIQGINNLHEMTGSVQDSTLVRRATLWRNGNPIDLGLLEGGEGVALNESSQIALGMVDLTSGVQFARFWENGTVTPVDPIDETGNPQCRAINNKGQVVGHAPTVDGNRAFLWDKGVISSLGTLGGESSHARALNDVGMVVGQAVNASGDGVAFLWRKGKMTALNSLIDPASGWFLLEANDINNAGQIIGHGIHGTFDGSFLLDLNACIDTDGNGNPDNDGDGLCDDWETDGIDFDKDGIIDLQLYDLNQDGTVAPGERADPNHKDLYVEIDWMAQHAPFRAALNRVVQSFAESPVSNPDGSTGIRLHLVVDEEAVGHAEELSFSSRSSTALNFDDVKKVRFGTSLERGSTNGEAILAAKRLVFRYAMFAHSILAEDMSGQAEIFGNDLVVTLGRWTEIRGHGQGNLDEQSGTFMHELGHSLGLDHGGFEALNCKPNYLSIMSWSRQFDGAPVTGRRLDFSRQTLPTIDEASLSEASGISGPAGIKTSYVPPQLPLAQVVVAADGPIDWNGDGDTADVGVSVDVTGPCASGLDFLEGYEDWSNLQYDFRTSSDFADGVHRRVKLSGELTREAALELSLDGDGDGITNLLDNCMQVTNATQADGDDDGVGDACDNCRLTFNPGQEAGDCEPSACIPETCDGLDNDCNGEVDDGLGTVSCGVGACARTVNACEGGVLHDCVAGSASLERCDGQDQDCDGRVDAADPDCEATPPPEGGCGCGAGAGTGGFPGELIPIFLLLGQRAARRRRRKVEAHSGFAVSASGRDRVRRHLEGAGWRSLLILVSVSSFAACGGCGSLEVEVPSDGGTDGGQPTDSGTEAEPDAGVLEDAGTDGGEPPPPRGFELVTPNIDIPPGQEITLCYYFRTPNTEPMAIQRWRSEMTPGVADLMVYATTDALGNPADTTTPGTVREANCGFNSTLVTHWLYAAQTPTAELRLPSDDGTGRPLAMNIVENTAGFLQMKLVNPTGSMLTAKVKVTAEALDAEVAYTRTATYLTHNAGISIPPHAVGHVESQTCTVPADVQFWRMSMHAHKQAVQTLVKSGQASSTEVIFTSNDWEQPGAQTWATPPFYTFQDDTLTFECTYDNTGANSTRTIQSGLSTRTDELCMAIGYFFPATRPLLCFNSIGPI